MKGQRAKTEFKLPLKISTAICFPHCSSNACVSLHPHLLACVYLTSLKMNMLPVQECNCRLLCFAALKYLPIKVKNYSSDRFMIRCAFNFKNLIFCFNQDICFEGKDFEPTSRLKCKNISDIAKRLSEKSKIFYNFGSFKTVLKIFSLKTVWGVRPKNVRTSIHKWHLT